jgi:DNA-binding transcriptional LysR family regulator
MAAEEKNISRASDRLNVSQPAVSRQIKDLEEELGVQLFIREPSGLSLTDEGSAALVHAQQILRQSNTMMEAMKTLSSREKIYSIKVGFLPTALPGLLTNAMREFSQTHPDYCVQIFEMSPTRQEEALLKGEINLALIGDPGDNIRREFRVETISRTELAMLVPDSHALAGRKSVDLAEFGSDTFVTLHEDQFPGRIEMMAELFSSAGINPKVAIRATGLSELLGLIGGGAGVAVAPADLKNLLHPGVAFLKMRKPSRQLQFSAVWQEQEALDGIEALVEVLKSLPDSP